MSSDQNPGNLLYRGDYTTQLYGDCNSIMECQQGFERCSSCFSWYGIWRTICFAVWRIMFFGTFSKIIGISKLPDGILCFFSNLPLRLSLVSWAGSASNIKIAHCVIAWECNPPWHVFVWKSGPSCLLPKLKGRCFYQDFVDGYIGSIWNWHIDLHLLKRINHSWAHMDAIYGL